MRVFVATQEGQGEPGDYCWTVDGELVRLYDCPDEQCRCSAFSGLESHRAVTTAKVVERHDLDETSLYALLRQDLVNQGFGSVVDDPDTEEWLREDAAYHRALAAVLEPGTWSSATRTASESAAGRLPEGFAV